MSWFRRAQSSDFFSALQQSGMTASQLVRESIKQTPLGHGGNATVYPIPGMTNYVLRVRHGSNGDVPNATNATPVADPFNGQNFGQPVADLGNGITVLLKQNGNPAGYIKSSDPQKSLLDFKNRLQEAAQMPQEAYNELAKQLEYLNQQGYDFDPSKSNNILIEPGQGFRLVDLNRRNPNSTYKNDMGHIVICLMHNYQFNQQLNGDAEAKQWAASIIQKCTTASQAIMGQPIQNGSSYEYSRTLAGM